mgnify:CR=1 FL=1
MKATGIVRRVDELGRVVIPKEMRRTMLINEGDPLEFLVDGQSIVLRKYSDKESFKDSLDTLGENLPELSKKLGSEKVNRLKELINEMKGLLVN